MHLGQKGKEDDREFMISYAIQQVQTCKLTDKAHDVNDLPGYSFQAMPSRDIGIEGEDQHAGDKNNPLHGHCKGLLKGRAC